MRKISHAVFERISNEFAKMLVARLHVSSNGLSSITRKDNIMKPLCFHNDTLRLYAEAMKESLLLLVEVESPVEQSNTRIKYSDKR